MAQGQYNVDIYNCYIRFGWPENFDRAACRMEVIKLMKLKDRLQRRFYASKSDTPLDEQEEAEKETRVEMLWNNQVQERKATGGKAPRKPRPKHSGGLGELQQSTGPRDGGEGTDGTEKLDDLTIS